MESYNDGVVKIFKTENIAEPGKKPIEKPIQKASFRFRERTVGNTKFLGGKQYGVEIERLIRCPLNRKLVSPHDLAEIQDISDNESYRYEIEQIQYPENVYPRVMDLSLVRKDWGDEDV